MHGKYLTPGQGITATSLAAVVLRGIVLNILVWLPLAVFAFCMLQSLAEHIGGGSSGWLHKSAERVGGEVGAYLSALTVVGAAYLAVSVIYSLVTWRPILLQSYCWRRWFERQVRWLLWTGLALALLGSLPLVSV